MSDPVFGIVITCYDLGEFLSEAVDSCLSQTVGDIEVVVVDDGSTDEATLRVLGGLEGLDDRLEVLRQDNKGLPGARNAGVAALRAPVVSCLDADDKYDSRFVEKTLAVFERAGDELGFVTFWTQSFGDSDGGWETVPYSEHAVVELLTANQFHAACPFRKSAWERVGGYDESMTGGYEDWDFWISLVEAGYRWELVPERLFLRRVRGGSMLSGSRERHDELARAIVEKHGELYSRYGTDVIVELMGDLAERNRLLAEQDRMLDEKAGRMSEVYRSLRKVREAPGMLLKPENYAKLARRVTRKPPSAS